MLGEQLKDFRDSNRAHLEIENKRLQDNLQNQHCSNWAPTRQSSGLVTQLSGVYNTDYLSQDEYNTLPLYHAAISYYTDM